MTPDPYEAAYRGPAFVSCGDERVEVSVVLSGHHEPIDGKYHWYGRITADDAVSAWRQRREPVTVVLPGGEPVPAKLGELDPWGNVRVTGTDMPPYPLETLEEIEPR